MSEQVKKSKKRKKSYYRKCSNKRQKFLNNLDVDMRGFLITCNNNEKQAVREAYNILNEYADDLYGPEELQKAEPGVSGIESASGGEDMEKEMQKEISALKTVKSVERRFQNVDTKAKNCIFIKTTLEDPCELAYTLLTDLALSKKQKTRFALRLLPISGTCRAHIDDIKNLSEKILKPHFDHDKGLGFTVVHKVRNNDSIGRVTLLPTLGQVVKDMNALHRVCHDEPDVVVLIEVIGKVCCISVVKEFFKLRKYNLHEVIKSSSVDMEKTEEKCELQDDTNSNKDVQVVNNSEVLVKENVLQDDNKGDGSELENNSEVVKEKTSEK